MIRRMLRAGFVALASLLLAACATPSHIAGTGAAFERVGRFAVHLQPLDGEPRALQGGFAWRDEGGLLRLDLANPVGSVLARVTVRPGRAELLLSGGKIEVARNPDELLARVWGHAMPVSGMRAWLRGQVAPGSEITSVQYDAAGRLLRFEQQGWRVQLAGYDYLGPTKVTLMRTDDQGQWRLRLVMDGR